MHGMVGTYLSRSGSWEEIPLHIWVFCLLFFSFFSRRGFFCCLRRDVGVCRLSITGFAASLPWRRGGDAALNMHTPHFTVPKKGGGCDVMGRGDILLTWHGVA